MNDLHRKRNVRLLVAIVLIIIGAVAAFFAGYYMLGFMDDPQETSKINAETTISLDSISETAKETAEESEDEAAAESAEAEEEAEPSLTVDTISIIFDDENQERDVKAVAVNTGASEISFTIENEDIASVNPGSDTVSENGNWCTVTSKQEGTTALTISCGDFSKTVEITCDYTEKKKAQAEAEAKAAAEAAALAEEAQKAAEEAAQTAEPAESQDTTPAE